MIEEIKKLRVKIDGLAQMTKDLRPFMWKGVTFGESEEIQNPGKRETGIIQVRERFSLCPGEYQYKFQAIIDTDRGTFRYGSTMHEFKENDFVFDRNSKEINKAIDSLLLAKAWFGKALGSLGESTPYANDGKRKTVEDIEPAADVAQEQQGFTMNKGKGEVDAVKLGDEYLTNENWFGLTHIERVDRLREMIGEAIEDGGGVYERNRNPGTTIPTIIAHNIHTHLCEARFWLGFELQRIKEGQ